MNRSTSRLLASTLATRQENDENGDGDGDGDVATAAVVNEARVALHYWSRRWYMHFHPGFGRAAKGSALTHGALRGRDWRDGGSDSDLLGAGGGGDRAASSSVIVADLPGSIAADATAYADADSFGGPSGDHGARTAERLLDWSVAGGLVPLGLFDDRSDGTSHMEKEDREGGTSGSVPT